ncbi:HEAT repeat domain-containing protein [Dendronalium sp. ChiSLP03b]|uniref:HEAT repeat domain-containing protein n=1 Tax=Dendronalium sp. ChiSLP03b TaxID=3075381 RepID=UPI002AD59293|nr:HEAT repeat domain-containing protein [Dendronalium sp. ChiSLP03b]MDZ8203578.1 HEAT repeat domain-containing protein [Dendronalium sp. ChiSLP03b]
MNQNRLELLELKLRTQALNERKAALDELASFPAEVAVPLFQKLAQEKDVVLCRFAVMGLGNHRTDASFQVLQQILEHNQDGNVLSEAANSLFEFGDVAIPLLQQLFERSDNWLVRQTVISLLMETNNPEVLLAVAVQSLEDETQSIQQAGIQALGHLLKSSLKNQALALLTELAQDSDWQNRWQIAIALQGCEDPQAQQLIAKLQQDEHFRVALQ